ncbi:LPXTG cell wall anchor domain-containing protein, partial [Pseudoglutamicibacter cumminsii]|uniref:LPXTG cell wall anchor domain-containing protein n=1 Tax=Pseudoglutamicibacter cumminsii TaxID=156979 RepID=UPI0026EE9415
PTPEPSEDPTPDPSEDPTEDPTGEPGESPSESPSAPGADNNKPAQPQKPGTPPLARTGVNAGGALATVALMMLGGVGLLVLRRRPSQR